MASETKKSRNWVGFLVVPLALAAATACVIVKLLEKKQQEDSEEPLEEVPRVVQEGGPRVVVPSGSAEKQGPPSPAGEFHDAAPELDDALASPVISQANSPPKLPPESQEKQANGGSEPELFEEAAGEEDTSARPSDDSDGSYVDALLKRAQGAGEKLDRLVEANVPK